MFSAAHLFCQFILMAMFLFQSGMITWERRAWINFCEAWQGRGKSRNCANRATSCNKSSMGCCAASTAGSQTRGFGSDRFYRRNPGGVKSMRSTMPERWVQRFMKYQWAHNSWWGPWLNWMMAPPLIAMALWQWKDGDPSVAAMWGMWGNFFVCSTACLLWNAWAGFVWLTPRTPSLAGCAIRWRSYGAKLDAFADRPRRRIGHRIRE